MRRDIPHAEGKRRHCEHGPYAETNQISYRLSFGRQREHRQDAEQMGTSRQSVQCADGKSGVRVAFVGGGSIV